ncbi:MAG: TIGR02281 family clan AA aspartic protease [Bdellovibrionales bacterium]|nr:TIGR02281 family clan AA aspartic protease [Ramlibacter sp.]
MKLLLLLAALACGPASAQTVGLSGMLGNRALLIVDGHAPKSVAPGETFEGVKVVSTSGDQAVVELGGKRVALRVGDAPASVGARGASGGGGNGKIVLTAGSGGHFMTQGAINGNTTQFMVDTGATVVSLSVADAERMRVNYKAGQPVRMSTANGTAQGWAVKLNSVRIAGVEIFEVDAVVTPQNMPFVLLGNSFLTRFQMQRDNDQMTLTRRY